MMIIILEQKYSVDTGTVLKINTKKKTLMKQERKN